MRIRSIHPASGLLASLFGLFGLMCLVSLTLLACAPARAEDAPAAVSPVKAQAPEADNPLTAAELSAFRQAVRSGNVRSVRNLLEKGASPNFRMDNGDTAFTYAMRADTPAVAETLLASGRLAVNDANKFGETPLMLAVFKGDRKIFEKLLEAGADPKAGGNWTPLHYAATEGRSDFIERLLELGVSPNLQTNSGVTPLIMAARKPSRAAVVTLLRAGAYRDYCTDQGRSPADFARRAGDEELALYLAVEKCAVIGPVRKTQGERK